MIAELLTVVAPVFAVAGIGYAWGKSGRSFESEFVTRLVTDIGTPCLVFSTLTQIDMAPAAFAEMGVAATLAFALFAAIGAVFVLPFRLSLNTYLPALMFPNCGNMGLPLSLFAFGEAGLALAIVYFAIACVLQFTLGQWIAAGRGQITLLFRTPVIYAVPVALLVSGFDLPVPQWIAATVKLLGGLTVPLMLIALGVSLARLGVRTFRRSLAFAVLRLFIGLGVGLGLAWAFGFTGAARGVMVLQSAMPVAVFNYLFAQRYGRAPEEVAAMVVLSTVISLATLPLLVLIALP